MKYWVLKRNAINNSINRMIRPTISPADSQKLARMSRLARSLKYRLTRLFLGRENEEVAYWNDQNAHIEEAIRMAGKDEVRITNFITNHDGFGLHTAK